MRNKAIWRVMSTACLVSHIASASPCGPVSARRHLAYGEWIHGRLCSGIVERQLRVRTTSRHMIREYCLRKSDAVDAE